MNKQAITWLHVEASTRCNAWCPACPRNNNGIGLKDGLIEQDLNIDTFVEILEQLPNLHCIQFCGNYGDPIIAQNILELVNVSKIYAKRIQIHTNGSLRSTKWWEDFAVLLLDIDHDVWFGIDGIDKTHEIYRQGTKYNTVIKNAQAFISKGGLATWQFIPYAHNEHQLKESIILSQQLKFKKFKLVKSYRNIQTAKHYQTNEEFNLLPPEDIRQFIKISQNNNVDRKDCMHLSIPSIYLSADGKVSTCCYFGSIESDKKFNSIDELLYSKLNLLDPICLSNCGN